MDPLPETTVPRRNGLLRWIAAAGLLAKTGLTRLLLKRVVIRQDHIVATFGL